MDSFVIMHHRFHSRIMFDNEHKVRTNEFTRSQCIKQVLQYIWGREEFHEIFKFEKEECRKDDKASNVLRKNGNESYLRSNLTHALLCYNSSIRYASTPTLKQSSINLSFGYGNRSAVLFDMKLYDLCLIDIKRALPHYPVSYNDRLLLREVKCHLAMNRLSVAKLTSKRIDSQYSSNTTLKDEIKEMITAFENDFTKKYFHEPKQYKSCEISYSTVPKLDNSNELFPSVSDALVMSVPNKGRGFKANRDIKPGEVLLQEKAFTGVLNEDCIEKYCSCCMKRILFAPVPCETCASVIYCDENCRDEAYTSYHAVECSMLPTFIEMWSMPIVSITFRILCRMHANELLKQYLIHEENLPRYQNNVRLNPEEVYKSDDIQNIFSLETHPDKKTADQLYTISIISLLLLKLFASEKKFDHMPQIRNLDLKTLSTDQLTLAASISTLLMNSRNAQSIVSPKYIDMYSSRKENVLGCGIFLTTSLINHSWKPNLETLTFGEAILGIAKRAIKAGTEVCRDYDPLLNHELFTSKVVS